MSSNTKHSKIRNTGILFELLTRQITVDVLNNNKKAQAAKILKEFFNKKTELGKEYELYKVLTTENYKSEAKANHLVDAVISTRQKLNNSQLKREKYNLIKEIKKNYNVNDFFMARIPNYKVNASIFKLSCVQTSLGTIRGCMKSTRRFRLPARSTAGECNSRRLFAGSLFL